MYAIIIEQKDDLMHVGKGHDDNPPGRGSGRYPYGSGERPFKGEKNPVRYLGNKIKEHDAKKYEKKKK